MKFYVWKMSPDRWRFSNLSTIGGDCETWAQAFDEGFALAHELAVLEPTA
jgi:hypothetical protein